ncbi:hypothetical protein NPIL_28401 [Nephila pilipes]|uniref:Uncharacterized protein n=1 Tax=Nephila pilipes TaxID=299642 RepID=A0A8X6N4N7_NEPPI|nr:hypothetical protein NPIL_28401 [Nephila pilipes]
MEELIEPIGNLKVKKQPGSDNVFPEFLKHFRREAQNAVLLLYNTFGNEKTGIPPIGTYTKPILICGREALISAPQNKVDVLERTQNKSLRLITGAVVSTPIVDLQFYTSNPPVAVEIKKQTVNTLVRKKVSQRANWRNDWQKNLLKPQTSPGRGL